MERLGGLAEIPLEPGILRALVAVDVKGDIPGLLIAQTPPWESGMLLLMKAAALSMPCIPAPQL